MRRIISISIILTFFTLYYISSSALGNGTSITLIYTSNTLGEVESCGCPEAGDAGGLGRRSYYIDTVRKEAKNLLILDGGDAWCSVILIERARGKRRGGEQGWF